MNWMQLNVCLVVLALLYWPSYFVAGEDGHEISFHEDDEILPSDRSLDSNDAAMMQTTSSTQPGVRVLRQSHEPDSNANNGGSDMQHQFARGFFPAQPLDAQASSASKNVIYSSNGNTFSDLTRPAEETLKRLTRNPEVVDDIVGQFQELGGGVTKNILQQVSQTAPDISRSFGQALNEALTQTKTLAQAAPRSTFNLTRLTQSLRPSNLPDSLDFSQLGQALSQNFFAGATQNLLGSISGQAQVEPAAGRNNADAEVARGTPTVGSAAGSERNPEQDTVVGSQSQSPFEQPVGHALLPLRKLGYFGTLNPMSLLGQLSHLLALSSEINEVRVLPEQNSPYKISPKPVDLQTMAEMKLKAVLKDALTKKTIPILWFHLPNKNQEQKTLEEQELVAKLDNFEQQVIAELKQLQELAKMANEVKNAQLQSGFQPTASLTTKLNLFEIPLHDITLADIEKTLKDEHVMMLMQSLMQKKSDLQRHQQAGSKYITDLTGAPTKRQTIPNEETLKNMGRDDMLKMMMYAYRMAALNGHEMPWVKEQMSSLDDNNSAKFTMDSQQGRQFMSQNQQMDDERKWLLEKEQRMRNEGNQMMMNQQQNNDRQMMQEPMMNNMDMMQKMSMQQPQQFQRQWVPMNQVMQRENERKWMEEKEQRMNTEGDRMIMSPQMQQQQQPNNQIQRKQESMMNKMDMQQPQQMTTMSGMQHHQNNQRAMEPPIMNKIDMPQKMPMDMQQQMKPMSDMHMTMQQHQNRNNEREMGQPPMMMDNIDMPQKVTIDMPHQMPMSDMHMAMQQHQNRNGERQMMPPPMMNKMDMPQKMVMDMPQQMLMQKQQTQESMSNTPSSQRKMPTDPKPEQPNETVIDVKDKKMPESQPAMVKPMAETNNKQTLKDLDKFNEDMFVRKSTPPRAPVILNYYYPPGGSYYPLNYGGGYTKPPPLAHYHYNHSPYAYRAAVGDAEIAQMLRYEQPKPKLMMMMRTPNNAEPTIKPTETIIEKNPTDDLNEKNSKRLAKTENDSFSDNVAAYVVFLSNNENRSSSIKLSRSRRKRSTEYATLEPIDESSLDTLRKTYKNSLKEITLNPNETPAEALMRYNADSVREALEKANKYPMEITTGDEVEEVKGANADGEVVEQHQQHVAQQKVTKTLPQTYSLSENGQFVPVTISEEALAGNGPHIIQPLTVSYNPSPAAGLFDSAALQGENYSNIISKYHSPGTASNKFVAQNPYSHVHTSLGSVPYMDNNSVLSPQAYQLTNHATVDGTGKVAKAVVYQSPQLGYLTTLNAINKNLQNLPEYEMPVTKSQHVVRHLLHQTTNPDAFSSLREAQSFRTEKPRDSISLETIIAVVKQQLIECCNKCKNDILQNLNETLKRRHYADTVADKSHTLTYRKPDRYEDFEYKRWLAEMSSKGYNRKFLTKQHQQDYLKDGKLNLHVEGEPDLRHEVENVFFKNSQSFKRETILPEIEADGETETVTAAMSNENKTESPKEQEEDAEEEDGAESENYEDIEARKKQISQAAKEIKSTKKIKKETESVKNKKGSFESKPTIIKTAQPIELVESTTHSLYTLRGKFRPSKSNPMPFKSKQGKYFATYRKINKLGHANSIVKSNDKAATDENIEDMMGILQDLSIRNVDGLEESFTTAIPSPTTTTSRPLSTSATDLIWKISNSTEAADRTTNKKLSRRKSKSRKSSPKSANAQ